jgi:hypothetical protein
VWWCIPKVAALIRWQQEGCKFKAYLRCLKKKILIFKEVDMMVMVAIDKISWVVMTHDCNPSYSGG